MGQAKLRGTKNERVALAIAVGAKLNACAYHNNEIQPLQINPNEVKWDGPDDDFDASVIIDFDFPADRMKEVNDSEIGEFCLIRSMYITIWVLENGKYKWLLIIKYDWLDGLGVGMKDEGESDSLNNAKLDSISAFNRAAGHSN